MLVIPYRLHQCLSVCPLVGPKRAGAWEGGFMVTGSDLDGSGEDRGEVWPRMAQRFLDPVDVLLGVPGGAWVLLRPPVW